MSAEALGALLGQLNAVPGVIGSLVSGGQGQVLASAFPPSVDPAAPAKAAQILADQGGGLAAIGGPVSMFSMRFGAARLLVRPVGAGHLLVLCAPSVNAQPVALLAAATTPKLERLLAPPPPPAPAPPVMAAPPPLPVAAPAPVPQPAPPPAPGRLFLLVQRIEAVIARRKLDPFRTRGAISMAAGVGLRAIDESTPDDDALQQKLEAAAQAVLGERP